MKQRISAATLLLILATLWVLQPRELSAQTPRSKARAARSKPVAKLRSFEEFVTRQMAKEKIPGLTIGFTKDNFTWVKGFGYADVENKTPAKAESAYRLASVTKTMTGTAILQLVEKGKIDLDGEIQTYVPYYPKQKWPVTVRQLLVHLGGGQTGSGIGPEFVTTREVVARIAKYPIKNEPGVKFDYQTSGYNLLGAAIEEVSGKSFGEYLRENVWAPLGMKDTRMDNVRDLIPNRVRGYELVNGEIKNAPFLDVSSRFGGGGANGTVPDMLRWADNVERAGILSPASLDLMFTPVANKGGRYVGLDDGTWYYTLGWLVFPLNGRYVFYNDGGQTGTNTMVLRVPSANLSMSFAANRQDIDRMQYVKRLYETITNEPWDIPVYTKDRVDAALYKGMSNTFDYGSLYYDQFKRPVSTDAKELAAAFTYFNQNVNRNALEKAFQETSTAIDDGRHPVAETAFIKVGSYMAMKLREKYNAGRTNNYHTMGAITFFADYIQMYKTDAAYPKSLQFNRPFEETISKWNSSWTKTWTEYTRHLSTAPEPPDLNVMESNLKRVFAGAEVYPKLIDRLLEWRQSYEASKDWGDALRTAQMAAELYPQSDITNAFYAISLTIVGKQDEARIALKKAALINANGIASARTSNQIALAIAKIDNSRGIDWVNLAVELYPREASLYVTLGDLYQNQGQQESAASAYKKALEIDPNFEPAKEALKKLKN